MLDGRVLGEYTRAGGAKARPRTLRVARDDPGRQPHAAGGRERGSQPGPAATGAKLLVLKTGVKIALAPESQLQSPQNRAQNMLWPGSG